MAGLDPAIQSNIEILSFFLDGRVKHGHDKGRVSPLFRFTRAFVRMTAEPLLPALTRRLKV
jgi:hypothetical protein